MEIQDRLEVKLLEARGLDYEGSNPNCFVEIICGLDKRQSKIIAGEGSPKWNSKPYIFNNILGSSIDTMIVILYHRDSFTGRDVDLGWIQISLNNYLSAPQILFSEWLKIKPTTKMLPEGGATDIDESLGELKLGITYFNEIDPDVMMLGRDETQTKPPNLLKVISQNQKDL